MSALLSLFKADFSQARYWLRKHTIAKILVALASLLVLLGLINIIFWGSYSYFWSIKFYEPYGQLTASYVLHSGFILTTWFVFLSAFVQAIKNLINPSPNLIYLMSQPLKPLTIGTWMIFKTWIINTFLMVLLWLPVALSYNFVYSNFSTTTLVTVIILITAVSTALIQIISATLSLLFTPLFKGKENLLVFGGAIGFFSITVGIIALIFPPSLRDLLKVEISKFDQLFSNLPLNQPWVISGNIIKFLETTSYSYLILPLIISSLISISGLILYYSLLIKSWQKILSRSYLTHTWSPPTKWWYKKPLMLKEYLSVMRNSSERNSLFFFLSLLGFFFYFLRRSLTINPELSENTTSLAAFSLGAILFISTAFLLRIVFPLLTREGKSAWYLLREPKGRLQLQTTKSKFGRFLTTIFLIIILIGWSLMPLSLELKQRLIVFSTVGIILLGWLNSSMGLMMTDWEKGSDPEQVSTSGLGIITLTISLTIITGIVMSFLQLIDAHWTNTLIVLTFALLLGLHRLAQYKKNKYQYPQSWN
jgi:hypothetical protein